MQFTHDEKQQKQELYRLLEKSYTERQQGATP
jgi:hypothetical protein